MKLDFAADIPPILVPRAQKLAANLADLPLELPAELGGGAGRVLLVSEFVATVLERQAEQLVSRVLDAAPLGRDVIDSRLRLDELAEAEAMAELRRLRQVEMARIAWRDLAGLDDVDRCLHDLSSLADLLVERALEYAMRLLEPRYGRPVGPGGRPAPLLVLAMGKLGGRELNFSSDIDLVFLFPDDARLGDRIGADVQPYYLRLAQTLIKLLDQRTEDGIVFRTDARLRPFGESGPLVVSLAALESYLVANGRDWERYAYQKARLLTGRAYTAEVFDELLHPYVYRGYLDYGVFDALRQMKRLIRREVARKDMSDNIKLGPGGIREIEFVVQAFQLLRGGRDRSLRGPSLLPVLPRLTEERQLGQDEVSALGSAYRYLRRLENRLQAMNDRQTHRLPGDAELKARLAYAMGKPDWAPLHAEIGAHRRVVESVFDKVARESRAESPRDAFVEGFRAAWEAGKLETVLDARGRPLDRESIGHLREFRDSALYQRMDEISRQRLASVVAATVDLLAGDPDPGDVLARLLLVYQSVCRRSAYLALLIENQGALENLLLLARRSESLCRQVASHPILLDELLDPRIFDEPPTREEFRALFGAQLGSTSSRDVENSLDALRQFHSAAIFRIAIADTLGQLPLMKVSDRLTDTAELVVQFALDLASDELVERYGRPMCGEGADRREAGFAIVAYGKLAGLELGYGSDLDLVFIHDSRGGAQQTDGHRSIDNQVYFARLAQRLIHFLSIQTAAGRLYEIDTRLRPSGHSGLLVTSMDSFEHYQRQEAWVWEHQALLRSRAVAGSRAVCEAFARARSEILIGAVDRARLKSEVVNMRARMRQELSKGGAGRFDLKQDAGGLADIEFLVDYLVLENLPQFTDLAEYPDNVRQLEALARVGILSAAEAASIKHCYLALRQRVHDLALDGRGRIVDDSELVTERRQVSAMWDKVFGRDT